MAVGPTARDREDSLVWGAPLVVFPALALVPVGISFFVAPFFPHARLAGLLLLLLIAMAEISGLTRLAACFSDDFDILSLLAGGVIALLIVIAMCGGVLLALIIFRL